jgi:hypothetical protein
MEVEEKYVSVGPFKPDGVGILIDLPTGGKISWGEVEAIIQIESEIEALVKQAATYSQVAATYSSVVSCTGTLAMEMFCATWNRSSVQVRPRTCECYIQLICVG